VTNPFHLTRLAQRKDLVLTSNIMRRPSRPSPQATYLRSVGPEVWLYDELHLGVLLESGVLDPHDPLAATKYKALAKQGLVVGYGLPASQHVTVTVQVGAPLDAQQLSELHHGRWLAPETALLHVPTGRVCIESRERLADTPEFALEPSGRVYVPPGRYRLSLYRSDDAARERESLAWSGPQQVVVLTPGGTRADAAERPLGSNADSRWPLIPSAACPPSAPPATRSASWCA
jgi:hypothetical protein